MNKNISYIKERVIQEIKTISEYKTNMYYGFITSLAVSFLIFFSVIIITTNFNNMLPWSWKEAFFLTFFGGFFAVLFGAFWFGMNLQRYLLEGHFNSYLTKPLNSFIQYTFHSAHLFGYFTAFIYAIFLFIFFILYKNELLFSRLPVTIILAILGSTFFTLIFRVIDSVEFFFKNNNFLFRPYLNFHSTFDNFPSPFFSGKMKKFSFLFANTYYNAYTTHYFFGHVGFQELIPLFINLIILIPILTFTLIFMWHYGLKRYEAFG